MDVERGKSQCKRGEEGGRPCEATIKSADTSLNHIGKVSLYAYSISQPSEHLSRQRIPTRTDYGPSTLSTAWRKSS